MIEGTYVVTITGTLEHFGNVNYTNVDKLESVTNWSGLGLTDLSYAFNQAINLTTVPSSIPSSITNMLGMFQGTDIFNQDISSWDVSNVTKLGGNYPKG